MKFEEWFNAKTEYCGMSDGLSWGSWKETLRQAYNEGFKEGSLAKENDEKLNESEKN